MFKFCLVRELYALSKADIARIFGVSQQLYTKYETGKTQRIPYDFINKFASKYGVNETWLMGEAAQWDQFMRDDIRQIKEELSNRIQEVAEQMRLPPAFIQAVFSGEVEGSKELWQAINRQMNPRDINESVNNMNLRNENARLKTELADRDATIRNLNKLLALLEAERTPASQCTATAG
jgi:transcriptional regulator with XRE-family HTH domain